MGFPQRRRNKRSMFNKERMPAVLEEDENSKSSRGLYGMISGGVDGWLGASRVGGMWLR